MTSSIKLEVHDISQCHQRRTEPLPQGICPKILWRSVQRFQRDMLTDRQTQSQTERQTDCNTPLPYRGGVIICCGCKVSESLLMLFASDSTVQLPQLWNARKTSPVSQFADHTSNTVAAKTTEPSVVDFDKINSRFMMIRQQSGYGFLVAEDFLNLSWYIQPLYCFINLQGAAK